MNNDFDDMTNSNDALKVCVFGASSGNIHPDFAQQAYELGSLIGQKGWTCLNGAGREGLMRAVSDGTLDSGGTAIGVIPKFMVDNNWQYDRLTSTIITPDMHERKQTLANLADAFVALPGGCGTLEELLEIFTQVVIHNGAAMVRTGVITELVFHRCAVVNIVWRVGKDHVSHVVLH